MNPSRQNYMKINDDLGAISIVSIDSVDIGFSWNRASLLNAVSEALEQALPLNSARQLHIRNAEYWSIIIDLAWSIV